MPRPSRFCDPCRCHQVEEARAIASGTPIGAAFVRTTMPSPSAGSSVDRRRRAQVEGAGVAQANPALVVVVHVPAQPVEAGPVRRRVSGGVADDLGPVGLGQGAGGDELLAVHLAAAEVQAQPLGQVAHASS